MPQDLNENTGIPPQLLQGIYPILNVTPATDVDSLLDWACRLVDVGIHLVQVRAKGIAESALPMLLDDITGFLRGSGMTVILNDYVELVGITGADGVHLGLEDFPVSGARRILGSRAVVGATCRISDQALSAITQGASYVAAGSVFESRTKEGPPIIGTTGLKKIVDEVRRMHGMRISVCAIGGIDKTNISEVRNAGADIVAVVGAVQDQDDPLKAAEALVKAWEKSV
jgi:thiamine-phosphate diphosphorylase